MPIPLSKTFSYDLVQSDGAVRALGGAPNYGSLVGRKLVAPIVALVPTPDHKGYWLIGADASVFGFGDAKNEGNHGGKVRPDPVTAAASTPDGDGYWLLTAHGRVYPLGDAQYFGSITEAIKDRAIAIATTPDGKGYWIATSDGEVFKFGDAKFFGDIGTLHVRLAGPVVAMAATPDGGGYRLAESTGAVIPFGDAPIPPTAPRVIPKSPAVGLAVTPDGNGDWIAEQNGTVLHFGTAGGHGSITKVPRDLACHLDRRYADLGRLDAAGAPSAVDARVPLGHVRLRRQLASVHRAALAEDGPAARAALASGRDAQLHGRSGGRRRLGRRLAEHLPGSRGRVGQAGPGHRRGAV